MKHTTILKTTVSAVFFGALSASALSGCASIQTGEVSADGISANGISQGASKSMQQDAYFVDAQAVLAQKLAQKPITTPAKNVILFVGDGMSHTTVTAIRILEGQLQGGSGEDHVLSWEEFPYTAFAKTYTTNRLVPDSAGTATAFLSGTKTKSGVIGVNQSVPYGDCAASIGNHVPTILELSEQAGLATGIVTTTRLTHATPAAAYAHSAARRWESDGTIPPEEKAHGCVDIAQQFLNFSAGDGIEVAFGGGQKHFLPTTSGGEREDGRNLIEEWQASHEDGQYITDTKGFAGLDLNKDGPILGLFGHSNMSFEADRTRGDGGQPSLADMTQKAIQVLQKEDDGFFLLVEAGRIDHAHHGGNAYRALHDGVALAQAVEAAKQSTNAQETLIIVTADHSHGFVMTGSARRGMPIFGKTINHDADSEADKYALALDGKPYTLVGYYNGRGATLGAARADLTNVDTQAKGFIQQAVVPLPSETHAADDVGIYANGPGAYLLQGVVEQNYIFHVMHHALRLGEKPNKK